jgi:hypothetical protein
MPLREKNPPFLFVFSFFFFTITYAAAQENSPYSRYGLGNTLPTTNVVNRGMGGISAAYTDPLSVNFANPASYSRFQAYHRRTLEAPYLGPGAFRRGHQHRKQNPAGTQQPPEVFVYRRLFLAPATGHSAA